MENKIFYRETGYNRTSITFFEVSKETKCFYYLVAIGKFKEVVKPKVLYSVTPNDSNKIGSPFRIKKTNKTFFEWKGKSLIENTGYIPL
jgi:hypothetical protein